MKRYSILLMLCLVALIAKSQAIDGPWKGALKAGGNTINIVFNFCKDANGKDKCTLDSPDQGVKGIPATIESLNADSVKISVPTIGASYEGKVSKEQITGKFSQSGFTFDLTLTPGIVVRNRPQTPQPPYAYTSEEVYFSNTKDNATLCGTLTYPLGFDKMAGKSVPVVLMVTGSGLQNRDEELFEHKPFLVIADYLAKHGIASLRYDDRSMGKSKGDARNATTFNNMNDAAAGIEYLRARKLFGKIGVLGHSEGGCIAFMLGARGKVDFIVSLAGTAVRGDSVLVSQNRILLKQNGAPVTLCNDYCKALKEIFLYKLSNKQIADAPQILDHIISKNNLSLPEGAKANLRTMLEKESPWLSYFIGFDPGKDIAKIKCPTMALNGSRDTQVESQINLPTIRQLLHTNKKNLIKEYDGLNHLFQHCTTGTVAEYGQIEETISPEVLGDIANWINDLSSPAI